MSNSDVSVPKVAASISQLQYDEYAKFGSVDENGNVYVVEGDSKRLVGQFPDGLPQRPYELYIRRFLDLKAQVDLFEQRLENLTLKDIDVPFKNILSSLQEPAVIGDLATLKARVEDLKVKVEQRKEEIAQKRAQAREQALVHRTAIVEEAEQIAQNCTDSKTNWKQASQRLRDLLEEWKQAQRQGPRLDRQSENSLWKRFSQSRTTFDRHRRQYFSHLDQVQAEGRQIKEDIVARAVELQDSTDWGKTSSQYRQLLAQWKMTTKLPRKVEDELWEKFNQACNVFYKAREQYREKERQEYAENLESKLKLLEQAEAILPVTDLGVAKSKLREIQEAWDQIGYVPQSDISKVNARLQAVETAVKNAEEEQWKRSNPETKIRANGLVAALENSIPKIESQLADAQSKGDEKKVAKLQAELDSKKQWLEQALKAVAE